MSNTLTVHFDGNTYNHTEDSLISLIKSDEYNKKLCEEWHDKYTKKNYIINDIRQKIHAFFENKYSINDTDITIEVDDINSLLLSVGCEPLRKTWAATVSIDVSFNHVEGVDEDEVIDYIQNEIEINYCGSGDFYIESIDVSDVVPQE